FALLSALGPAAATAAPNGAPCAGSCSAPVVQSSAGSPASTPCVRDAGCGGGAVLTANAAPLALAIAGPAVVVLAPAGVRRRRPPTPREPRGRLPASGLFHPPRHLSAS